MQKNLYTSLILVFTLISFQSIGQVVVPNGGFEKFTEAWGPNKFESWESTFVGNETEASTDAHSGKAAIKVFNNDFSENAGGRISCKINNSGTNYPLKLKGFVKYAVAPGEKVEISVSTAYTRITGSQTATYIEPIG
ncbi:MAG TPA: hypothetical protein VF691_07585 [Cytophagaceae bacterium]|jgi:hypothetical protein